MTIHAVLLIPAEGDPMGLLREGPCGTRPPIACRHGSLYPGVCPACSLGVPRPALVLAWEGEPVPEGLDRAARCGTWDDTERRVAAYLRGRGAGAYIVPPSMGTIVLLDAYGEVVDV